jgi:hypothetical protein
MVTDNKIRQMKPIVKEDSINKSILLNWLYPADKDLPIAELGKWIELRTNGKYVLVKKEKEEEIDTLPINKI